MLWFDACVDMEVDGVYTARSSQSEYTDFLASRHRVHFDARLSPLTWVVVG